MTNETRGTQEYGIGYIPESPRDPNTVNELIQKYRQTLMNNGGNAEAIYQAGTNEGTW